MRLRQLWQVGAIKIVLATSLALSSGAVARAAGAGSVDSYIETLMTRWQIPGAAVAVVQDDKIVFIKGYGLRQTGRPERVDENTTFGIGSVTKSFTATAAAMLVDEGKLAWDAPIIDYLPSLHFADPWITAHGTLRDLASHRLGIDGLLAYLFIGGDLDQTLRRARFIQPQVPFRTFQYSNTGYALLGKAVESASGSHWDEFITNRLLTPLGMNHSYSSEYAFVERANLLRCWLCAAKPGLPVGIDALRNPNDDVAVPHGLMESEGASPSGYTLRVLPWRDDRSVVSAGMIHSSAKDMAHYMMFHLSNGEVQGKRLMSERQLHELHSSQTLLSSSFHSQVSQNDSDLTSYGMGWMIGTYRGLPVVEHAGGRVGFSADLWLLPQKKLGIVVLMNLDATSGAQPHLIARRLADQFLKLPLSKGVESGSQRPPGWQPVSAHHAECQTAARSLSTPEAAQLVGKYRNDLLGEVEVTSDRDRLAIVFEPQSVADLVPAAHDRFTACSRGYDQFPMPVRFSYDSSSVATGFALGAGEPGLPNVNAAVPYQPAFFERVK